MSGGIAYVLDEDNDLYTRMNKEMVFSEEVSNKYDVMELKDMIKEHVAFTNSEKGKEILDNFSEYLPKFKKVIRYDFTDRSILCEYARLIVSREYEKKMEEISWENQPDLWIIKERHR